MEDKEKVLTELRKVFRSVTEYTCSARVSKFLLFALQYYKIDVSEYELQSTTVFIRGAIDQKKDGTKILYLNEHLDKAETSGKFTTLHELCHIVQVNSGRLKIVDDHNVVFENKEYTLITGGHIGYEFQPWEIEANDFAINSELLTIGDDMINASGFTTFTLTNALIPATHTENAGNGG